MIGIGVGGGVLLIFVFIIIICCVINNRRNEDNMKKMRKDMDALESRVANECKDGESELERE